MVSHAGQTLFLTVSTENKGLNQFLSNLPSRIQVSVMKEYGPKVNGQLPIEKYDRN